MFGNISIGIKTVVQFFKSHHFLLLGMACVVVLLVIAVLALTQILGLKSEVRDYENEIVALNTQMQQWEQAAAENEVLVAENKAVADENAALSAENDSIVATNSELERQNGELLKKFDGLSKPQ